MMRDNRPARMKYLLDTNVLRELGKTLLHQNVSARVHGLVVVTRNVKDFDGRGVTLLDPFKATRPSCA